MTVDLGAAANAFRDIAGASATTEVPEPGSTMPAESAGSNALVASDGSSATNEGSNGWPANDPLPVNPMFWNGMPTTLASLQSGTVVAAADGTFADQVAGTQGQPIDHVLSALSDYVYGDVAALPDGWEMLDSQAELDGIGLTTAALDKMGLTEDANGFLVDVETGFQAGVFVDEAGNIVIAFAGTDPGSCADINANANQGVGWIEDQYVTGMQLTAQVGETLESQGRGGDLVLTGHSLGGGIASAASVATGAPAVTFNAAGPSPETLQLAVDIRAWRFGETLTVDEAIAEANGGQIRRYYVEGEVLTTVQEKLNGPATKAALVAALGLNFYELQHPLESDLDCDIDQFGLLLALLDGGYEIPAAIGSPVVLDQAIPGMGNTALRSPAALHGMDAVSAGLEQQQPEILGTAQNADGTVTMQIRYPTGPSTSEVVTVVFADAQAANRFESDFLYSGARPPADAAIVATRTTSEYSSSDDDFADQLESAGIGGVMAQHFQNTLYAEPSTLSVTRDGDGTVVVATLTLISPTGGQVRIEMQFDDNGNEIVEQRTYSYVIVADEASAPKLNELYFDDQNGPIQPGESYTIVMTQQDMEQWLQGAMTMYPHALGGSAADQMLIGTGHRNDEQGLEDPVMAFATNLGAAIGATSGHEFADSLLAFDSWSRFDQPPGQIVDAEGNVVTKEDVP